MNPNESKNDDHKAFGYSFLGPPVVDRTMPLSNGIILVAYHQSGVVISTDQKSPFSDATIFTQGTTIKNEAGAVTGSVQLHELTDSDGDTAWACGYNKIEGSQPSGHGAFRLVQGTGKWQGITGTFKTKGIKQSRADDHIMLDCEILWDINPAEREDFAVRTMKEIFSEYDTGFSFHGAHIVTRTKELSNGLTLIANNQSGVLLSESTNSPRHNATCYDRGTTIKSSDGKTLGDVMLLEDTDADGDVVWLYHEWWYEQGPGSYDFIGGIGKWEGISGIGQTLGMVTHRADDHYMPTWEMYWKFNR